MGIVQHIHKEVREIIEEETGLLVDHLTLKDPLGVQALHLTEVRGRGITRTVHVMNSRRKGLLPLMVR